MFRQLGAERLHAIFANSMENRFDLSQGQLPSNAPGGPSLSDRQSRGEDPKCDG
jgi:hypothetical protein